jgi:fatty-acyl-CoA synthase
MHGAGYLIALSSLLRGGCVITIPGTGFDATAALNAITVHKPRIAVIVGDAFARPLAKALDASPGAYDLSSLMMVISSGAVWSPDVKAAIGRHNPNMMLMDSLGSSEVLGMGASVTVGEAAANQPTRFMRDANTRVINDDGNDVAPGSGEIGRIHRGGPAPIGYYKDPEKSARTFVMIDGKRFVVPGDYATVEADGAITLIGRGSQVINTGGEKVFVEEVEAALKSFPGIEDALVFATPDPKWGQAVTAVVEAAEPVDHTAVQAHLRATLADFKTPKRIIQVARVPRGPNGKADYGAAQKLAASA